MPVSLLTGKLRVPPTCSKLVVRPRLIDQLNEGLTRKLTLVSAPAGFGKTTLVADWVRHLARPTAWLSLDEDDNDPARFCLYLGAALEQVSSDLGETMQKLVHAPEPLTVEAVLTLVVERITALAVDFVLVLDDYHVIHNSTVHRAVKFLIENQPPLMHLVILTREDPLLPLPRLRVRSQMTEIRAENLQFAEEEAAAFLNGVMALDLTPEEVAVLEARTEGWIAGLQLAAIALQSPHVQAQAGRARFIQSFTGDDRHIMDYLVEEVLSRQPAETQHFLLCTSILEQLCASLCDAVVFDSSPGTSRDFLEHLEGANLFVVPLDNRREWYRYHHLFADLLQHRLRRTKAEIIPALHRRAGAWYEKHGHTAEAVRHALAANDIAHVARLFEQYSLVMLDYGTLGGLVEWFEALPETIVQSNPWLCIFRAWVLAYTARPSDMIERLLRAAEDKLDAADTTARHVMGHITSARAYIARHRGERRDRLARQALDYLPEGDAPARSLTMLTLASVLEEAGNLQEAAQLLAEAIKISRGAGDSHIAMMTSCALARLQVVQGRLRDAAATCSDALLFSDRHAGQSQVWRLPFRGYGMVNLAGILCEQNDLELAVLTVKQGVDLCEQWGQTDVLIVSYTEMARVLLAAGDSKRMHETLEKARRLVYAFAPADISRVEALEARLWLAEGNLGAAARWASDSGLHVDDAFGFPDLRQYLEFARVLVAQCRPGEALSLLARHLNLAEASGAMDFVIQNLIVQALALQAQGKTDQAMAMLAHALRRAEPEGYIRTFVEAGTPMAALLYEAAARGISPAYAGRLLLAFPENRAAPAKAAPKGVEMLTARELEVLRLIAEGLSNQAIARQLVLTLHTVKSHTRNIYRKLGAQNRTQAAAKARMLGILPRS